MSKIKKCPFCGSDGHLYKNEHYVYIACPSLDCPTKPRTKNYRYIKSATIDWNMRCKG